MASSPEASPRRVGRVIDPAARDDGQGEPDLQLEPEFQANPPARAESEGAEARMPHARGAVVRERLLQRAAAARQSESHDEVASPYIAAPAAVVEEQPSAASTEPAARSPFEAELDLLAGEPPKRSTPLPVLARTGQLSPNLLALFGALLGLSAVATLVALGMHFDPPRALEPTAAESPATADVPAPSAAPAPRVREHHKKLPSPWRVADAKSDPTLRVVEGQIGSLPFLKALEQSGVPQKEAYRALKALSPFRNLDNCEKSDRFAAALERSTSRLTAIEYEASAEDVVQARQDAAGLLVASKLDLKIERSQVRGAFALDGSSIDAAAQKAGLESGISKVLARALDGHLGLDELGRGDTLRVVAQQVSVLGEFARYSGIEAAEVRFRDPTLKPLRLYWFQSAHSRGYYDASAHAPYEGGWRKPIKDAPVTSKFNPKRMHPVLHKIMPHNGTDFGAGVATPVGASSYGTVSFIGYSGPSGNLVKIDHANGITTGYAHLSRFAEGLHVGDKVKRLQIIGYVGSTGRSTGPHLHFSAERGDKFFDAETLNLDGMRVVPNEERAEFAKIKAGYDALLDAIALPVAAPAAETAPHAADALASAGAKPLPEPTTAAPANSPAFPVPAASGAGSTPGAHGSSVYLSDKELLKMQSATDEGEVAE